jgi:hypothetical protein
VQVDKLILEGLTGDEQLALREEIDGPDLEMKSPTLAGGRAGEPVTIAVILIGKIALLGLSAFLLKKRRQRSTQGMPERIRLGKATLETDRGRVQIENLEIEFPAGNNSPQDLSQAITTQLNGILDHYWNQK